MSHHIKGIEELPLTEEFMGVAYTMKTILYGLAGCWLLGFSLVNAENGGSSYWEDYWSQTKEFEVYQQKKRQLRHQYRIDLSRQLVGTTRIEVFLFEFDRTYGFVRRGWEDRLFSMGDGMWSLKILRKKVLDKKDSKLLVAALAKQLADNTDKNVGNYNGILHGIRLYTGDKKTFETTFTWSSRGYYVDYPDGDDEWRFTSDTMREAMYKVMPVPAEMQKKYLKE